MDNFYIKVGIILAALLIAIGGKLVFNWSSSNAVEKEAEQVIKEESGYDVSDLIDKITPLKK